RSGTRIGERSGVRLRPAGIHQMTDPTLGLFFTAAAYGVGALVFLSAARGRGLATEGIALVALWGLVGGVLGARLTEWLLARWCSWRSGASVTGCSARVTSSSFTCCSTAPAASALSFYASAASRGAGCRWRSGRAWRWRPLQRWCCCSTADSSPYSNCRRREV